MKIQLSDKNRGFNFGEEKPGEILSEELYVRE